MSSDPLPPVLNYSPDLYDEGYYRRGERCGFKNYVYDSPDQQTQLAMKWDACRGVVHGSALFIGCAMGYEVAYWKRKGRQAAGCDVSQWAIDNALPEVAGAVRRYDGRSLSWLPDNSVDLVASFDVLTHLPDDMLHELVAEMIRVARFGIVFRTIVKNWRNLGSKIDFQDGCYGRYLRAEDWDCLFSQTGKFHLSEAHLTRENYETTFTFLPGLPKP